jgi:predicted dehydrogenase
MKILIAGLGSIGRRHLRNLQALGQQDILLYRTHHSTLTDGELAGFPVETNLEAALEQQPDAVIVSNPTALHLHVAQPAAERGIHLFLEKPISHNLAGIAEFRQAVQRGGSRVLVGYQFRFHPGLRRVKVLLEDGALGEPLSVRAHWGEYLPGWHPWEDYRQSYSARPDLGGGVILTLSHPLDYLRSLLGEVESLWAFTSNHSDLDILVEDTAEIGLQFANGVVGSVHLDYIQRPAAHWLEVIGTHGTLRWEYASGGVRLFRAGDEDWQHFPAPPGFERNQLFLKQMRHFLALVGDGIETVCSLQDGIRALELALAAHTSARESRLVRFST